MEKQEILHISVFVFFSCVGACVRVCVWVLGRVDMCMCARERVTLLILHATRMRYFKLSFGACVVPPYLRRCFINDPTFGKSY